MGEIPVLTLTRVAAVDLSDHQYGAVTLNTEGQIVKAGAGVAILGILQEPVKAGQASPVMVLGVSFAKFSAASVAGSALVTDANGFFKTDEAVTVKTGAVLLDNVAAEGTTGVLLK